MFPKVLAALFFGLVLTAQPTPTLFSSCDPCQINTVVNLWGNGYPPNLTGGSKSALNVTAYCGPNPDYHKPNPTIFYRLADTDSAGNFSVLLTNPGGSQISPLIFPSYVAGMDCYVYASVNTGGNNWINLAEIEFSVIQ